MSNNTQSSNNTQAPATGPGGAKLRDSCDACSASKVRCDKTKPVCGRCQTRGTKCEYLVARRLGRSGYRRNTADRQNSSTQQSKRSSTSRSSASPPTEPERYDNTWDPTVAGAHDGMSAAPHGSKAPPPQTLFSPSVFTNGPHAHPMMADDGTNIDDTIASFVDTGLFSNTPLNNHTLPLAGMAHNSSGSISSLVDDFDFGDPFASSDDTSMSYDTMSMMDLISPTTTIPGFESAPNGLPADLSGMGADNGHFQFEHKASLTCTCLQRSVALLQQRMAPEHACEPNSLVESIIKTNHSCFEQTETMLNCSCSSDESVLSVIVLIIFKMLSSYAKAFNVLSKFKHGFSSSSSFDDPAMFVGGAAPRRPQPSHTNSTNSVKDMNAAASAGFAGGDEFIGDFRTTAQGILNELHLVQKLINGASHRCRERCSMSLAVGGGSAGGAMDIAMPGEMSDPNSLSSSLSDDPMGLPDTLLNQLESDLRKRLRALSANIIEGLRCF